MLSRVPASVCCVYASSRVCTCSTVAFLRTRSQLKPLGAGCVDRFPAGSFDALSFARPDYRVRRQRVSAPDSLSSRGDRPEYDKGANEIYPSVGSISVSSLAETPVRVKPTCTPVI